jgi:Spy/CpxP family protein refolding chaperone
MKWTAVARIAISLALGLSATSLFAQERMPMRPHGMEQGRARLMEELKLTDDQKKEVGKIRYDLEKQMIAQRAKIANARLELRQLTKADNPDKGAIEKKIGEVSDLGSQTHVMMLNQWFAVNKLLNPDQQKVWKKVLENAPRQGERMRRNFMMRREFDGPGHEPMEREHHD